MDEIAYLYMYINIPNRTLIMWTKLNKS